MSNVPVLNQPPEGIAQRKHTRVSKLPGGQVEPRSGIPHTHPVMVTCDQQSSSTGRQMKTAHIQVGSATGMQEEKKGVEKGAPIGLLCLLLMDGLFLLHFLFPSYARLFFPLPPPRSAPPPDNSLVKWQGTKELLIVGRKKSGSMD